jgi:hypothetical protein
LTEITQQIHSLRASGVISSHFALAMGSEMRTFCKSAGTLCTAPGEIAFLVMDFILLRYAVGLGSPPRMPCNALAGSTLLISPNCVFDASLVPETCLEFSTLPV